MPDRRKKPFKETLNTPVRPGLSNSSETASSAELPLEARPMNLMARLDAGRLNSLLDEMETDAFIDVSQKEALE